MNISLNEFAHAEEITRGTVLFKEGSIVDAFYIIESGTIRCLRWNADRLSPFLTAEAGDIVGEDCVFSSEGSYFYSAVAIEDSTVIKIDKSDVDTFLSEQSPWVKSILDNMSEKIENTTSLIAEHRIQDEKLLKSKTFSEEEEVALKSKL